MYNSEQFIAGALESVFEQAFPCEIIVVDDCSTDASADIASEILSKQINCPWKIIRCQKNVGVAEARNKGVAEAEGKYVAFLDIDDLWRPGKLKKQYELMEKSDCVLCSTAREFISFDGRRTGRIVPTKEIISYDDLLRSNLINLSSVMIKRDVALRFPMDHAELHEDYITWLRILKEYGSARGINEALLLYRKSSGSKTGSKWKSAIMHYKSLRVSGIGTLSALRYFVSYAVNGVIKHGGIK